MTLGWMIAIALIGCSKSRTGGPPKQLLQREEFTRQMCACKDLPCTKQVGDAQAKWFAEKHEPDVNPDIDMDELHKRTEEAMTKYQDCFDKISATVTAPH